MKQAITGIVLAGGRGRRAGGADKGLLPWGERTRIEVLLDDFAPQVDRLLISCNRNLERYAELAPVVADELPDYQGPLAGIAAGLERSDTDCSVVLPCDCPHPPRQLAARLLEVLWEQKLELVYSHDGRRPQALGLFDGDRLILLYTFESDLGDGWEDEQVHNVPAAKRMEALRMGANIIVWALTH